MTSHIWTDDIEAYALNASGVVNIIVFDPKGWALFRSFRGWILVAALIPSWRQR
ncbi:hypothetical protein ECZU29_00120 [Escherichia coli]|nr:hypothetical protein ECZU29_00120 [Escherichia coli]